MTTAFRSKWERLLGRAESPIESLFLEQFCAVAVEYGYGVGKQAHKQGETIVVIPQKWIDKVRVDYLIAFSFFGASIEVIVECDGHEFHERTKLQAKRDRSRDRALQQLGYKVFRFTGSEINAAPRLCAHEVLDTIMDFQTARFLAAVDASAKDAA